MSDLPKNLERSRERWLQTVNATDLEGYVSLLAEDGVWLPPGGAPIVGRAAFEAWLRPFFERFDYEFEVTARVQASQGWAAEAGRFTSRLTPRGGGGEPMEHSGTYTLVWRRDEDGTWRIDRYIDDTAIRTTDAAASAGR